MDRRVFPLLESAKMGTRRRSVDHLPAILRETTGNRVRQESLCEETSDEEVTREARNDARDEEV